MLPFIPYFSLVAIFYFPPLFLPARRRSGARIQVFHGIIAERGGASTKGDLQIHANECARRIILPSNRFIDDACRRLYGGIIKSGRALFRPLTVDGDSLVSCSLSLPLCLSRSHFFPFFPTSFFSRTKYDRARSPARSLVSIPSNFIAAFSRPRLCGPFFSISSLVAFFSSRAISRSYSPNERLHPSDKPRVLVSTFVSDVRRLSCTNKWRAINNKKGRGGGWIRNLLACRRKKKRRLAALGHLCARYYR